MQTFDINYNYKLKQFITKDDIDILIADVEEKCIAKFKYCSNKTKAQLMMIDHFNFDKLTKFKCMTSAFKVVLLKSIAKDKIFTTFDLHKHLELLRKTKSQAKVDYFVHCYKHLVNFTDSLDPKIKKTYLSLLDGVISEIVPKNLTFISPSDAREALNYLNQDQFQHHDCYVLRVIITIASLTGMRIGEICDLRTHNLVNKTLTYLPKKRAKKAVSFELPDSLQQLIEKIQVNRREKNLDYLLFFLSSVTSINAFAFSTQIKKYFKEEKEELGNKISHAHGFRRGVATHIFQETRSIEKTQNFLNHSSTEVTERYIDKIVLQKHQTQIKNQLLSELITILEI